MRRPSALVIALVVLACGLRGIRAEPSGPDAIREFREGWGMLGNAAEMDHEEYDGLIAWMEWLVDEIARSDQAGHDVLVTHLRTPTSPVRGPGWSVRRPYMRIKIAIADAAARFGLSQAIPALTEVVASFEAAEDTLEFGAYRELSVRAAEALAILDGRSAVPALRDAFDHAFERMKGSCQAPMLRYLPAALVALGDNAWLEDRLIFRLESESSTSRATAAFVAQQTLGEKLVPHLIAYLRETGSPKAVWALREISGQSYPGLQSWEAWWARNAARPRDEWTGLPATPMWKEIWARDLFETMRTRFLCNKVMCWRKEGYGAGATDAALQVARQVHALDIESSMVERLRGELDNDSEASCCGGWGPTRGRGKRGGVARGVSRGQRGTSTAPPALPKLPDSYCRCGQQLPLAIRETVAVNADRLLAAIACVEDPAPCSGWIDFNFSMNVATTEVPKAQAPTRAQTGETAKRPAGSRGRSDARVARRETGRLALIDDPTGLRWRLGGALLEWGAVEGAARYYVYRGDRASLKHLADGRPDACLRLRARSNTSWRYLLDRPAPGHLLWYLVGAVDAEGREGAAGSPDGTPRVVDSTGPCSGR